MTQAEFFCTIKTRTISEKEITLREWYKLKNIPYSDVDLAGAEISNGLGSLLFPSQNRTKHQAGKQTTWQRKYLQALEYLKLYDSEVGTIQRKIDIDLNRLQDVAYLRVLHRREIRKAIKNGYTPPPEVMSEYTDFIF